MSLVNTINELVLNDADSVAKTFVFCSVKEMYLFGRIRPWFSFGLQTKEIRSQYSQ
jgi:hypothetical protein